MSSVLIVVFAIVAIATNVEATGMLQIEAKSGKEGNGLEKVYCCGYPEKQNDGSLQFGAAYDSISWLCNGSYEELHGEEDIATLVDLLKIRSNFTFNLTSCREYDGLYTSEGVSEGENHKLLVKLSKA